MANYLFLFLMMLLFWQCQEEVVLDRQSEDALFGKAFVLEEGKQLSVSGDGNTPLLIEAEEVNDSRCPEDVVCVWLGNATVSLKVSTADTKSQSIDFCIGDCRPEPARSKHAVNAKVGGQEYEIILLEVLPYPNTKNKATYSQVKLLVNKLE